MSDYTHYIQVEAVNFDATIYDTSQLSIVRGGSLLLKLAVEMLDKDSSYQSLEESAVFCPPSNLLNQLEAISTGASSGIFATGTLKPGEITQEIADWLSQHEYFRHFTFTVVWEPYAENFPLVKERLIAKTRLQQLRQISIAPEPAEATAKPCQLQGILPAYEKMEKPPKGYEDKLLSPSCQLRFLFGRDFRSKFYQAEITALGKKFEQTYSVAESFQDIADKEPKKGGLYPNLANKMAVIHFDGNGFGPIQAELVKSDNDQTKIDKKLQNYRRQFLADLLEHWKADSSNAKLPLETLLWGGDEMIFVVPASKGFELVQFFYRQSRQWTLEGYDKPLTHAGGVVFCNYKTSIDRAKNLARELAESVKKQDYGRDGNYFDYIVLESIDYPAESLSVFFRHRYGELAPHRFPLSPLPDTDSDWYSQCADLLDSLPKGQAYEIVRAALADSPAAWSAHEEQEQKEHKVQSEKPPKESGFLLTLKRFKHLQDEKQALIQNLQELLWNAALRPPSPVLNKPTALARWQWIHLVELWDYLALAEENNANKENANG